MQWDVVGLAEMWLDEDSEKGMAVKGCRVVSTSRKKKAGGGDRKAGGYTAPVKLSEELADIVGGEEMPRHEVTGQPLLNKNI